MRKQIKKSAFTFLTVTLLSITLVITPTHAGNLVTGKSAVLLQGTSEIDVRNATDTLDILDGDTLPMVADGTDMGTTLISGSGVTRTFRIENNGSANLFVTIPLSVGGANPGDFSIISLPASPVAASGFTTFTVRCIPSAAGTRTADISITNNDSDENPYTFRVQCTGTTAATEGTAGDVARRDCANGNTGVDGGIVNLRCAWLDIPPDAILPGRDANKNACRIVVKEVGEATDFGFTFDETVWDIKIFCDGKQVTQLDSPITICVKPLNGSNANKTLFHRHGGLTTFNGLPAASGKSGWVCGSTSQLSLFLAGEYLLPNTGFAPETVTELALQPEALAYASTDIALNIPKLGLTQTIVGVPQSVDGWNVSWLGNNIGYLSGTAFPTWAGNTALTGHVWNADGSPGIFYALDQLQHGDQFTIEAWGYTYVYEVRDSEQVYAHNLNALEHSDYDIVTLITCEGYSEWSGSYGYRRVVTAVLVDIN